MAKKIEYFYVGQDVQIQIDHNNKEWFDEYGKLLIEDIEEFLQDNDFIEQFLEVWKDTITDKLYSFTQEDINVLKRQGWCIMYNLKLDKK